jgi:polyisoprenoid-binding protein YceI
VWTSRPYGTVRVTSVETRESARHDHLRSPEFFDASQSPEIVFESTEIEPLVVADKVTLALDVSATKRA